MVSLLGTIGLVDEPIVLDEIRVPLIRLAAEEPVIAVEPHLHGPLVAARARSHLLLGHVVILADPERAPAVILQDAGEGRALRRDIAVRPRVSVRALGD